MKVVIFDLWGDWGHFKKFYTTASPLTFHIPPPTAIQGIVGAILGLSYEVKSPKFYLKELADLQMSVQILNPIKTNRMGYNWIQTKKAWFQAVPANGIRYQTIIEKLKSPRFRIYLAYPKNKKLLQELCDLLQEHCSFYTPYLGISEHIAEFKFVEEVEASEIQSMEAKQIFSVIPLTFFSNSKKKEIQIESGKQYQRDRVPSSMSPERRTTHYESILYEINGKPILGIPKKCWELSNGKTILFFPK